MANVDFDSKLQEKYTYEAYCYNVYDGDTAKFEIDVGFGIKVKKTVRFYLINTPEMRGADKEFGKVVRDFVRGKILDKTVTLKTVKNKTGKYGRLLGVVYCDEGKENLNRTLLIKNYAVFADYK